MLVSLKNKFLGFWGFKLKLKKCSTNLVNDLTFLKHFCLQVKNLDRVTNIINNWLDDSCLNYTPNANLKNYLKVEIGLFKDNYELVKEAKYFEELFED
jgi:hypothetical protein